MLTKYKDDQDGGRGCKTIIIIDIDADRLIDLLAGVALWVIAGITLVAFITPLFDGDQTGGLSERLKQMDTPAFSYESVCRSSESPSACLPSP